MKVTRRSLAKGTVGIGLSGAFVGAPYLTSGKSVVFAQSSEDGGQIIIGLTQEPTKFNPVGSRIEVDEGVHYQLFDALWRVNEEGEYLPMLATEIPSLENGGISEDGLTWTVNLRDDVMWHDGEQFSAEDVKFTWELIMMDDFIPRTRQGHELVTSFEVVSATQVTWTLSEQYAPYLAIWALSPIVPKHLLEDLENPNEGAFYSHPVGTGAFMWGERVAGDHITLRANPDYYGEGPFVDTLVFKYIPDTTVFFTQFRTGEIDHTGIQGITAEHYGEASELPDRVVHVGPSSSLEFIAFNLSRPQFQELPVRQALYYALDKDSIISDIYYGLPTATESYLFQQSWAFNPDLPAHEFDPERANQLLDEAGWARGNDGIREKDGVRLEFTNSTTVGNKVREQAQAYLQQTWGEIGVSMTIENYPAAVVWGDFLYQSQFDSLMIGEVYGTGADPDPTLSFHSESPLGAHGTNFLYVADPELDTLLERGVQTVDLAERVEIYQQIQSLIREQLYVLPVFQYAQIEGTKAGLSGYVLNPNYRTNLWNVNTWRWS